MPYDPSSLIDTSYFVADINLVNKDDASVAERINYYISKYEPKCLIGILGYGLYKKVISEDSQRISDIIIGCEYTDKYGNLVKWDGLIQIELPESLVSDYVYYYYQYSTATLTTGVSTSITSTASGISVSPEDKMLFAWNSFSKKTKQLISFLWTKNNTDGQTSVYPEINETQFKNSRDFSRSINTFGL